MKYYVVKCKGKYVAGTVRSTKRAAEVCILSNPVKEERDFAEIEEISGAELFNILFSWIATIRDELNLREKDN